MSHDIDENTLNFYLRFCVEEYVRRDVDRIILLEHWFEGKTFEQIAEMHNMSVANVKKIIYGIGDKVLLRASKMSSNSKPNFLFAVTFLRFALSPILGART